MNDKGMTANIDEIDLSFLSAVAKRGPRDVSFGTIRRETGFSTGRMQHRFRKLVDGGYIIKDYADLYSGSGSAPKTATLTDRGRQTLDSYEGEPAESRSKPTEGLIPDALDERLRLIETRLDRLCADYDEIVVMWDEEREHMEFRDDVTTAVVREFTGLRSTIQEIRAERDGTNGQWAE